MSNSQEITIRVLDEGRRAEVRIPVGFDVANLSPSLLCTIAAEASVQITVEVTRRLAAIVDDYKANPRELSADFAHAIEPLPGKSGSWTWEPTFEPAAPLTVGSDEHRIDHRASHVLSVVTGTPIARLTPPTEGTDGRSVTGAVLTARRGNTASLLLGEGLEARSDGVVIAKIDGVLEVSRGVVTVSPVLKVKGSVDFSTGNIDFKGDVEVAEAVRDGFCIRTSGNITIHGPVEGARIICGKNLTCPRGIASSQRGTVDVGGDCTVGYVRNVTAVFRGDLACRGELERSTILVGGECHCENGRLIGGTTVLTGIGHIGTIGSPDWTPTLVCVGDLPLVAMELKRLGTEAARIQKAIAAKDEAVRHVQSCTGGKSAKAREQLTEFQYELSELHREAAAVEVERAKLQESVRQCRGAELHVARIVYPKVSIQHRDAAFEFEKELKGPLHFLLDERGMILARISSQDPRPITDFARPIRALPSLRQNLEPVRKCA